MSCSATQSRRFCRRQSEHLAILSNLSVFIRPHKNALTETRLWIAGLSLPNSKTWKWVHIELSDQRFKIETLLPLLLPAHRWGPSLLIHQQQCQPVKTCLSVGMNIQTTTDRTSTSTFFKRWAPALGIKSCSLFDCKEAPALRFISISASAPSQKPYANIKHISSMFWTVVDNGRTRTRLDEDVLSCGL